MGAVKLNDSFQISGQFDVLQKADIILISSDEKIKTAIRTFCEKFQLKGIFFHNTVHFHKHFRVSLKPGLVLCDFGPEIADAGMSSEYINLKTILKRTSICVLSSKSDLGFVIKPDITMQSSLIEAPLFHYLFLLRLQGGTHEIRFDDLFPSSVVPFNAYHFSTRSLRYIPVVFQRMPLSEKKFARLEKIKKLYIRSEDAAMYRGYIESFFDESEFGSKKRAKAHLFEFIGFFFHMKSLVLSHTQDQSALQAASENLEQSLGLVKKYLNSVPHPIHFISMYTKNEFLAFDQSWFVALVSSFFSSHLKLDNATSFSKLAMVSFPENLNMNPKELVSKLSMNEVESGFVDSVGSMEIPERSTPEKFPQLFIHRFVSEFVKRIDLKREIEPEDFMTTSRSFWRLQSETYPGEDAQKILVQIREVFCNK